jgi:hypothetical protein
MQIISPTRRFAGVPLGLKRFGSVIHGEPTLIIDDGSEPYEGVQRVRNRQFEDANKIKDLSETSFFAGDTVGTHKFYPLVFSPSRNIATSPPLFPGPGA